MHLVKHPALLKEFSDFFKRLVKEAGPQTRANESLLQGQWDSLWSQEMAVATTMRVRIHFIAQAVAGSRNLPS